VDLARYLFAFAKAAGRADKVGDVDAHGAGVFALAAQGAQPWQLALDELTVSAQQDHPYDLARVETADPREGTAGRAGAAGQATNPWGCPPAGAAPSQ